MSQFFSHVIQVNRHYCDFQSATQTKPSPPKRTRPIHKTHTMIYIELPQYTTEIKKNVSQKNLKINIEIFIHLYSNFLKQHHTKNECVQSVTFLLYLPVFVNTSNYSI